MSIEDGTLVFPRAPDTGDVIAIPVGRLALGDGSVIRLWLAPDGLHVAVPSQSPNVHINDGGEIRYSELGTYTR